jgi:hypothetical protein
MKMSFIVPVSFIISIIVIFYLIGISNFQITKISALDDSESFLKYNNSKLNFSIQYPSNWEISERKSSPALGNNSSTIEFSSPFEGPQDLVQEQFIISLNKLQKNTTFNEYVDNALNQFQNEYRDFKLISNNSTMIDNQNARKLAYSYTAGEDPLSIKIIMTDNIIDDGGKVYVLSLGTPPDKYYNFISIIQTMNNSFKILN